MTAELEALKCRLAEWDKALERARSGKSYTVDGITVTRQDIDTVLIPERRRVARQIVQLEAVATGAQAPSFRKAVLTDWPPA